MQVSYQNPLLVEHIALMKIRKAIVDKFPKSRVEITDINIKSDYTTVGLKIITKEFESSVCFGQVLSKHTPLIDRLKAEIVALVMAANELGIDFEFEGTVSSIAQPEISEVATIIRFDRNSVKSCVDMDQLYYKMNSIGMEDDVKKLKQYGKDLLKEKPKKILTVNRAADLLFPEGKKTIYATVAPKEKVKKEVEEVAPDPVKKAAVRDVAESQKLLEKLSSKNITPEVLKQRAPEYKNLLSLVRYGSDAEIKKILAE